MRSIVGSAATEAQAGGGEASKQDATGRDHELDFPITLLVAPDRDGVGREHPNAKLQLCFTLEILARR